MTAALTAGDYVRARLWTQFAAEKQAAVNTAWYVVSSVGASPSTDSDLAAYLDGNAGPIMLTMLPSLVDYRGVQVTINQTTYPYKQKLLPVVGNAFAGAGTSGSQPLPTQTAGLLRFQSPNAGPGGRGRWYIPFPPANANSGGGSPTAAYQVLMDNLAGIVATGIALSFGGRTATLVRVLVHSPPKGGGATPGPSPITSFQSSELWATQKRRGAYGRTNVSPI
jgi:hypothetical protein